MLRFVLPAALAVGLLGAGVSQSGVSWSGVSWSQQVSAIKIDNFIFSPAKLTVTKGTEVSWTNRDDIPHSIVLTAIGVRSKALDTDGSFTYRFDKAGTYSYVCGLHPQMHGQVVVR
jgi:plastocyanin